MDHDLKRKPVFLTVITLVLLLLSTSAFQSNQFIQYVSANSQPLFHPGYGTATIDGYIDPVEWATAASLSLPMYSADTPLTGTFYVMQTATDLYFGFTIDDDEFTQDPVGKWGIYGDMIQISFDDNNNGTIFEAGENKLNVYSYDPWFRDAYFTGSGGSSSTDTNGGGASNGAGMSARHADKNHFEARFPLCSGDTGFDFCLQPGDTLGFWLEYYDAYLDSEFSFDNMFYPGTTGFYSLALIETGDFHIYLPLILK